MAPIVILLLMALGFRAGVQRADRSLAKKYPPKWTPPGVQPLPPVSPGSPGVAAPVHAEARPVLLKILARVQEHESGGRFDAINPNRDGSGLSYGLIQWAQDPGSLGKLLSFMQSKNPTKFAQDFSSDWRELLSKTAERGKRAVAGRNLWEEPWLGRFKRAGKDPVWQTVQREAALKSEYMKASVQQAAKPAKAVMTTERILAMLLDTAIHQGPGYAIKYAKKARDRADSPKEFAEALQRVSHQRFRVPISEMKPESRYYQWKQVGNQWHAFRGDWDLAATVAKRQRSLMEDPNLSDLPMNSAPLVAFVSSW